MPENTDIKSLAFQILQKKQQHYSREHGLCWQKKINSDTPSDYICKWNGKWYKEYNQVYKLIKGCKGNPYKNDQKRDNGQIKNLKIYQNGVKDHKSKGNQIKSECT